jgi:hypothetical protein
MTAQEILDEIQMLGGRLEVRGDLLHVEAPKGVLKPEHREALATFKPELIELVRAADVLQALNVFGTWRTTKQIAAAVNRTEEAVLSILEALREGGSVDRDGGPIYIWLAVPHGPQSARRPQASGATIRAEGSDLKIRPAGTIPPELTRSSDGLAVVRNGAGRRARDDDERRTPYMKCTPCTPTP